MRSNVLRFEQAAMKVAFSAAAAALLVACAPAVPTPPSTAQSLPAVSPPESIRSTSTSTATASPEPSAAAAATPLIPACDPTARGPAMSGVVEQRPEGWSLRSNGFGIDGFPDIQWQVYGPTGPEVPLGEGPGRLVLYETFTGGDDYYTSRATASRNAGGTATEATICGDTTKVWVNRASGELLVGWAYRGKSDVLVANSVDFTVEELLESAERIYDCCG